MRHRIVNSHLLILFAIVAAQLSIALNAVNAAAKSGSAGPTCKDLCIGLGWSPRERSMRSCMRKYSTEGKCILKGPLRK
jgi:hypothetical protein